MPEDGGLGRDGWAHLHPLPLGTHMHASRTEINMLGQRQPPGLDLGTSWSCIAPPRLISVTGHTRDASVICGVVLHLCAVTCLSPLPSPHSHKKKILAFVHSFIHNRANGFKMAVSLEGLDDFSKLLHNLHLCACICGVRVLITRS